MPDPLCSYTDFRTDQRYYFQRYNSFWYGIYEYPSRKLFKKVYQETPCSGKDWIKESEANDLPYLSIGWGIDDMSVSWDNSGKGSIEEKIISGLEPLDKDNYEVLVAKSQLACFDPPTNKACSFENQAKILIDDGVIPKNHLFILSGLLEEQLQCLKENKAYPKDKSEIPDQCKSEQFFSPQDLEWYKENLRRE